jgi:hypothetical protein
MENRDSEIVWKKQKALWSDPAVAGIAAKHEIDLTRSYEDY